jgi:hypothetical protein
MGYDVGGIEQKLSDPRSAFFPGWDFATLYPIQGRIADIYTKHNL